MAVVDETEDRRRSELVRQAEAVLQRQLDLAAGHDARSRHLMATTMALVTAMVAALALALRLPPWPWRFVALIGLTGGLLLLFRAFLAFAHAYVGSVRRPTRFAVGWDPRALLKACEESRSLEAIHHATLEGVRRWVRHNDIILERQGALRRRGMNDFALGASCLVVVLIYVVMTSGQ